MTKACRVCQEIKPLDDYYTKKTTKDGLTTQCKACHNRMARERYESRKNMVITAISATCNICRKTKPSEDFQRDPTKANGLRGHCRSCQREKHLHRNFGMSATEYAEMLVAQNGLCKICRESSDKTLAVDHCHETGRIRGLLCESCNRGIGLMGDDAKRLRAAADYLEKN